MKKRLFPFMIGLAALAVSGSAAFYSVFGLSKLFAGASLQVIIMSGSLEFAPGQIIVSESQYIYPRVKVPNDNQTLNCNCLDI